MTKVETTSKVQKFRNYITDDDICKKLGIKMVFGLGDKIQSSSWLLKEKK